MCVILTIEPGQTVPKRKHLDAMYACNPDGAGVAWHDGSRIQIRRGIFDAADWIDTIHTIARKQYPLIAHARIATIGGVRSSLTHPWHVVDARGRVYGAMAHNGHYSSWDTDIWADNDLLCEAIQRPYRAGAFCVRPDDDSDDPWSDSRGLALILAARGWRPVAEIAQRYGQRVAYLRRSGRIVRAGNWKRHGSAYVSNTHWRHGIIRAPRATYRAHRPMTAAEWDELLTDSTRTREIADTAVRDAYADRPLWDTESATIDHTTGQITIPSFD